jgi:hypothetical protein
MGFNSAFKGLTVTATEQGGLCGNASDIHSKGSHFDSRLGHRPVEEFYHGFAKCLRADAATVATACILCRSLFTNHPTVVRYVV